MSSSFQCFERMKILQNFGNYSPTDIQHHMKRNLVCTQTHTQDHPMGYVSLTCVNSISHMSPWSRVLPEKQERSKLLKIFPAYYGTQRFITVFTRASPYPEPDQSSPCPLHPTSRRSILILSSHLCLGLPSGLLPSGFPIKALYASLLSRVCAICPAHLSLLELVT